MRQFKKSSRSITSRESHSIKSYLVDIGHYPLLTMDEEVALATKIRSDDIEESSRALNALVNSNLRFVVSVANQYAHTGIDLEDLISSGNLGLIKAAKLFDVTRGFRFISYAIWWIRQSITDYINNYSSTVRVPLSGCTLINKYMNLKKEFMQINGYPMSDDDVADKLGLTSYQLSNLKKWSSPLVSLDEKISDETGYSLSDSVSSDIETDSELNRKDLNTDILRSLKCLNTIERDVLTRSFGLGCKEESLYTLAVEYGKTRERIRQIRDTAVDKLRQNGSVLKKYIAA